MEHWGVSILTVAALLAGCAASPEPPPPPAEAEPVVTTVSAAVAGPALPAITLADRIKQEGWLVRFWEQLTPSQRRRVTTRLRQNTPPLAKEEADAAPIWDGIGLPERDALIFGAGLPRNSGRL
jgi:hypothetical protein